MRLGYRDAIEECGSNGGSKSRKEKNDTKTAHTEVRNPGSMSQTADRNLVKKAHTAVCPPVRMAQKAVSNPERRRTTQRRLTRRFALPEERMQLGNRDAIERMCLISTIGGQEERLTRRFSLQNAVPDQRNPTQKQNQNPEIRNQLPETRIINRQKQRTKATVLNDRSKRPELG